METFIARYRNITVLALAIFAQILLLGYQIRSDRDVRLIRLWGVTAITPVARIVHGGHELVGGTFSNYIWLRGARRQNEQLRAELDRLKLENQSLRNALGASDRLKLLVAYQQNITSQTTVASVIGTGANPNSRVVFLDRGSGAGIKPGMAVITPDGIAGKIQAVYPGSSLALLISDANSAAGVILEKSRAHGVLKGSGLNDARIEYVPNEEKVTVGEKVYTSGEDRIFPKGLVVGTVSHAQPGRDFQEITVQPGARLNRLEEVLVVTQGVHQEIPSTLPRVQAPPALLPPPPAEVKDAFLQPVMQAPASPPGSPSGTSSIRQGPESYLPQTEADKLKNRYRELGAQQGHTFGQGLPGSKPPDFNLGWTPPGPGSGATSRAPAAASPKAPAAGAPPGPTGAGTAKPDATRAPATGSPPLTPGKTAAPVGAGSGATRPREGTASPAGKTAPAPPTAGGPVSGGGSASGAASGAVRPRANPPKPAPDQNRDREGTVPPAGKAAPAPPTANAPGAAGGAASGAVRPGANPPKPAPDQNRDREGTVPPAGKAPPAAAKTGTSQP